MPSYYLKKENKEVLYYVRKYVMNIALFTLNIFLWQSSKYQNVVLSVFELTIFG